MTPLFSRKLLVVTGKGGTGKTTVTAALGLVAARHGRRVVLVEMSGQRQLPALLAAPAAAAEPEPSAPRRARRGSTTRLERGEAPRKGRDHTHEAELAEGLWSISLDPDQVLLDWLTAMGGKVPARLLASRASFRYFAAAAPGAKELLSLVRIMELTKRGRRRQGRVYDLAIVDAPATGHALAMLRSPATFGAIARVGPIAAQASDVNALLADPELSGYLAVTLASEAAVTETLELAGALRSAPGRELDGVIANGIFPRHFKAGEMTLLEALQGGPAVRAAVGAARFADERARRQQSQIRRVRRAGLPVSTVPFVFQARMERAALEGISGRLERAVRPKELASAS